MKNLRIMPDEKTMRKVTRSLAAFEKKYPEGWAKVSFDLGAQGVTDFRLSWNILARHSFMGGACDCILHFDLLGDLLYKLDDLNK